MYLLITPFLNLLLASANADHQSSSLLSPTTAAIGSALIDAVGAAVIGRKKRPGIRQTNSRRSRAQLLVHASTCTNDGLAYQLQQKAITNEMRLTTFGVKRLAEVLHSSSHFNGKGLDTLRSLENLPLYARGFFASSSSVNTRNRHSARGYGRLVGLEVNQRQKMAQLDVRKILGELITTAQMFSRGILSTLVDDSQLPRDPITVTLSWDGGMLNSNSGFIIVGLKVTY